MTEHSESARPHRRRSIVIAGLALVALTGCGIAAESAYASGGSGSGSSPSAPAAPKGGAAAPKGGVAAPKAGGVAPAPPKADADHVMIDGTVLSSTSSTIVVKDHDGFSRTIDTDSKTTYDKAGKTVERDTLTAAGTHVHAVGSVDSDKTSLDATSVDVVTGMPAGGPGGPAGPGPLRGNGAPKPPTGKGAPTPPAGRNGKTGTGSAATAPSGAPTPAAPSSSSGS